jgi:copper chaperone CopZ
MLIEGELGDIGVDATCDYAKGYVDVSFDEKAVSLRMIKMTIERLGYHVV